MPLLVLVALAIGLVLPLQAGVNAQLRPSVGHPVLAALVSFAVGTVALAVAALLARTPLPSGAALGASSWWHWTGGLLGALYIAAAVVLAPRLGAATLTAAIVAGQMIASIALDHFGLVGYPVHPLSWSRVLGAALIMAGVFLIQR